MILTFLKKLFKKKKRPTDICVNCNHERQQHYGEGCFEVLTRDEELKDHYFCECKYFKEHNSQSITKSSDLPLKNKQKDI